MKSLYCSTGKLCLYISYLIFVYLLLCAWRPARGQTPFTIQGQVLSSENQQPLIGASVLIKGSTNGTTTDKNGFFVLSVSGENPFLAVSFIGYRSLDTLVKMPLKSQLLLALSPDEGMLEEVKVSTGYWETSKRLSTGNTSKVTAEMIEKQPVNNVLMALQGRMAGVDITQQTGAPGGGFDVLIRGRSSITSGTAPLYIVNGVPFASSSLSMFNESHRITPNASPLGIINPDDIESIEILKDADATAIYGSRGANGVVLIRTKKAAVGKPKLEAGYTARFGRKSRTLPMLGTQDYIQMRQEAIANDEAQIRPADYDINGTWDQHRYTDWQEVLTGKTAYSGVSRLALSGGNQQFSYLLSAGNLSETTVFASDDHYNKASVNTNLTHRGFEGKVVTSFSANYAIENSDMIPFDLYQFANLPPNAPAIYNQDGQLNWQEGTWTNPMSYILKKYKSRGENLVGNLTIDAAIAPGLDFHFSAGITSSKRSESQINPYQSFSPYSSTKQNTATSEFGNASQLYWIAEPRLSYTHKLRSSSLTIMIGSSIQQQQSESSRIRASGFIHDNLMESISAAASIVPVSAAQAVYKYSGVYGRINYDLGHRYILNASIRRDGSSRFGPNRKYANFGAVGAAWLFQQEKWLSPLSMLSTGKLRASWGITGNDQITDYGFMELYGTTQYPYDGGSGLFPSRIFNPDFGWETNKKWEAAMDLGVFDDRILLSVAWFRNRSSNQLVNIPLPTSTGFSSFLANLPATIQNKGWEIELTSQNLQSPRFQWSTSLNLTVPSSKLVAFPDLEKSSYARYYTIGLPLTIQKRYRYAGVNPQTGYYQYENLGSAGGSGLASELSSEDLQPLKKIDKDFYGGLTNLVKVAAFELEFTFQFVRQTGRNYMNTFQSPGSMSNQPVYVLDRWQKEGDQTSVQKYSRSGEGSNQYFYTQSYGDLIISDASFIRLKNVSLSYSPSLGKVKLLQGLKIFMQSQNLLTFTRYQGLDPETMTSLRLPVLRTVALGASLSF